MKIKKIFYIFIICLTVFSFRVNAIDNDSNLIEQNNIEDTNNELNNEENIVIVDLDKEELENNFSDIFNFYTKLARDDSENRLYQINIPEGVYSAVDQLKVYRNIHIIMDNVVIVRNNSYNMLRLGDKSTYDSANDGEGFGGYGIYSNITIEGGTFDGNNESQAIIRMGHASNITLKNVTFKNVTDSHFVEFGAVKDVTVTGCTFIDFKGSFDSKTNYEALQIDALSHDHFGSFNPTNDETPSKNILIENNTFKNLQRGVGTHTGIVNSYFDNIVIKNNNFENITGYAIMATNYANSDISYNNMNNVGAGIMMRSVENAHKNFYASEINSNVRDKYYFLNNTITNNIINVSGGYQSDYSNVSYGIELYGEYLSEAAGTVPKGDFRISGVWINNNTINLNTLGYGIWVQGAIKNSIKYNNINVNIQKKKSAGGNGDGIRIVYGTNITVKNNKIVNKTTTGYDPNMNGITVNSSSKEIKINQNEIKNSRKYGIFLESSKNNSILNNTVYKTYVDSINLSNSKNNVIQSNIINKVTRDGVRLRKSTANTIKKNTITYAYDDAIDLLDGSTSNKIESNTINIIKDNGIYILKSNSNSINSNKITNIKKNNGIAISSSKKISIVNNTIKYCKKYGIYSSKNQISKDSKNKISKCKKARSWR